MTVDNFISLLRSDLAAAIYAIIKYQVKTVLGDIALPPLTNRLMMSS